MSQHSRGAGRARQDVIYRAGILGRRPRVPTDLARLEAAARRRMSRRAWAYLGYAGAGQTGRANRAAFERWEIVPRRPPAGRQAAPPAEGAAPRRGPPSSLAPVGRPAPIRRIAEVQMAAGAAHPAAPDTRPIQ